MEDFRDNMQKCREYVQALEEERKKIQVFQRELPLCLELVTQAIEACKQQLSGTTTSTTKCLNGHSSECSEQATSDGPILEEFMPLKRTIFDDDDDKEEDEHECDKPHINMDQDDNDNDDECNKGHKSDWLRSVQLWSQTPDPPTNQEVQEPKIVAVKNGGAFHPFQKEKHSCSNVNVNAKENGVGKHSAKPATSACSSAEVAGTGSDSGSDLGPGGSSKKEEKGGKSTQRKQRRCWSPELHKRFLNALQQLGGSHAATPKQIREMMKVDGLTNDEVKSHLQKYRLHTRRPSSNVQNKATPQAPQFVVVGGIWVPPPDYAAAATSGDMTTMPTSSRIYAPAAAAGTPRSLPQTSTIVTQRQQPKQSSQSCCEDRGSPSDGVHSKFPSTSSSTYTTACRAY